MNSSYPRFLSPQAGQLPQPEPGMLVAGKGIALDDVENAQVIGQLPGISLVDPHQRGVDYEFMVHGQVRVTLADLMNTSQQSG